MNDILKARNRRTFLRDSAIAAGSIAGIAATPPAMAFALAPQEAPLSSPSLSRQFAQWVVGLRYDDLPAAVIDRAKGLTLQNLASALTEANE